MTLLATLHFEWVFPQKVAWAEPFSQFSLVSIPWLFGLPH